MDAVIAFDHVSPTVSGYAASLVAEETLARLYPAWNLRVCPLASDGRDLGSALLRPYFGKQQAQAVLGATLEPVEAHLGYLDAQYLPRELRTELRVPPNANVAVIEAASACGLVADPTMPPTPEKASSYGLGQLIAKAAEDGARAILLHAGPVATLDLGLGALEAIGIELRGSLREPLVRLTPQSWDRLEFIVGEAWPHIPPLIYLATDEQTLLGPNGSVARRGLATGLPFERLGEFERHFGKIAKKLCQSFDKPRNLMAQRGAGDGGGLGFGLQVACDAELVPAAQFLPRWQQWDTHLAEADLVITGCPELSARHLDQPQFRALVEATTRRKKPLLIFTQQMERKLPVPPKVSVYPFVPEGACLEDVATAADKFLCRKLHDVFAPKRTTPARPTAEHRARTSAGHLG